EPRGRVPGPLRRQSGSPASRPPHAQRRAGSGGVAGGGGGVGTAGGSAPDQDAWFGMFQPPALGLLTAMVVPAQRGQIALARPAALVVGVGVVQVAARGAAAAARRGAGRVAGPDQVLELAAGPVAVLGSGVLARSADDRGEFP